MIFEALALLRDELEAFVESLDDGIKTNQVVLGNISLHDSENGSDMDDNIVISLVNVEEESALKNRKLRRRQEADQIVVDSPSVFLNLYILFTANWPNNYENALKRLAHVVSFFQHRNVFTLSNATHFVSNVDQEDQDLRELKIILDLYTMTFEQINHLWGSLGGKQVPFAMYKVRLVEIRHRQPMRSGPSIEEIKVR